MSWEKPENMLERAVYTSLLPASVFYGIGSYIRTAGYSFGALERTKLSVPVISVGNLSTGGTGKTPVTIDLARRLVASGHKVAVLSRGYKRLSKAPHVVVSDGKQLLASCNDAGDEPYLIAQSVPQAIVIVGASRSHSGQLAINEFGADIVLLDDGFQHIKLRRDGDIVLIDYSDDLEQAALLPAGRLREPLSSLGRASSIVISKVPVGCKTEQISRMTETIRRYNRTADISYCQFKPGSSHNLRGLRVLAFCGIAKPKPFLDSLHQLGANVIKEQTFADHYWYTPQDLAQLDAQAHKAKADFLVTTEKDLVRFAGAHQMQCPVATIRQETDWLGDLPRAVEQYLATPRIDLVSI
jgi:tetraacyldisaccharide 4'-kinase